MKVKYTSLDQLPITLCAEEVAQVLGISRANAYTLMHSKGFPTIKIGAHGGAEGKADCLDGSTGSVKRTSPRHLPWAYAADSVG